MKYLIKITLFFILFFNFNFSFSDNDVGHTRISIASAKSSNDNAVIIYIEKMEPGRRGEIISGIEIPFPNIIPKPEYSTKKPFYKYHYIAEVNNSSVGAKFYILQKPDGGIITMIVPTYCKSGVICRAVYKPSCEQIAGSTYKGTGQYPFSGDKAKGSPLLLDYLYLLKCTPKEMFLDLKEPCLSKSDGEKISCLQRELNRIDKLLNTKYMRAIKKSSNHIAFRSKQRAWITKRNLECLRRKVVKKKNWISGISDANQLLCLINHTTQRTYLIK